MAQDTGALRVQGLTKSFGGLKVFQDISFELAPSSVKGVIGPNGAGKTTLINVICGLLPQSAGKVWLGGSDITNRPFHVISGLGIVRSFQQTNTFKSATVEENLHRARHFSRNRPGAALDLDPLIEEFGLAAHLEDESGSMPYGKQKMLGLVMALAPKPRFLLLDEPAAGLEQKERHQIDRFIAFAHETLDCGVLIVEHDMDLVRRLCPEIIVLEGGRILAEGAPDTVLTRKDVMDAYLGAEEEEA
ncbi:MAG: ABC transporter ATP-binding protein [Rhodobacteraceae bacterium]|nr:ABC transporter ATP-binding protein [Paracoccaceae bacterium]